MTYPVYYNASYVFNDAERLFMGQSAAKLGPNLLSLAFTHLLQGVVIVQVSKYVTRWWNIDRVYTKGYVLLILLLSLVHTALITAFQWNLFVVGFGNGESLIPISGLARSSTLSATIFSLTAQAFFIARIYHLPWRFDYLFIPLIFFFTGTLGLGIGLAATPAQLAGTAFPETFRRLYIVSAVFPVLLSAGTTACILAFLSQSAPTRCTLLWHFVSVIHSAFPAMVFTLLDLTAAFESPPFALSVLTHSMVGYLQAVCLVYSLACRTHPLSTADSLPSSGTEMTADLSWTLKGSLLSVAPRLALLPLHQRAGDPVTSVPLAQPKADTRCPHLISHASSSHTRRGSDAVSGLIFMPPGLYDPRAFQAIYAERHTPGED